MDSCYKKYLRQPGFPLPPHGTRLPPWLWSAWLCAWLCAWLWLWPWWLWLWPWQSGGTTSGKFWCSRGAGVWVMLWRWGFTAPENQNNSFHLLVHIICLILLLGSVQTTLSCQTVPNLFHPSWKLEGFWLRIGFCFFNPYYSTLFSLWCCGEVWKVICSNRFQ